MVDNRSRGSVHDPRRRVHLPEAGARFIVGRVKTGEQDVFSPSTPCFLDDLDGGTCFG